MSKRKLARTCSSSDSDSDNECLLQLLKRKSTCEAAQTYNINPQNSLCKPSQESCEFCDRTFSNRLEALVHNANHIIIPLLRNSSLNDHGKDSRIDNNKPHTSQPVPSRNRLVVVTQHFNNKIILGNKHKPKPTGITNRIVFEGDNDDVISISDSDNEANTDAPNTQTKLTKNEVLSNFVADCKVVLSDSMVLFNNSKDLEQKSEIPNGNKNKLLNSFTADCRVALGKPMSLEMETKTTQDGKMKILTLKKNDSTEKKTQQIDNRTHSKEAAKILTLKKKESIEKITHQFENMCLPIDKNKGNKIEPRNTVQAADLFSHQNGIKIAFICQREAKKTQVEDVKITENGIKAVPTQINEGNDNFEAKTLPHHGVSIPAPIIQDIDETVHKSVHYDDLQKPGLYKCDLCKFTFPNRYSLFRHRYLHLQIRRAKFGYCIACERCRCIPYSSIPLCFNCNYKHSWHNRENYVIESKNPTQDEYISFREQHEDKTIKVCEVCSVFVQRLSRFCSTGNISYKKTYSLIGDVWNNNDEPCDNCGKIYNQMKLINKTYSMYPKSGEITKLANRIRFEESEKNYLSSRKHGKTNADRLDRIRSRIKKLNFINKF